MTDDYQVDLRRLTLALIRVYALFQFVTMLYGFFGLLWYAYSYSADFTQEASIRTQMMEQLTYVFLNGGILIVIYFQAERVAGWVFPEDASIVWSGDPYELALPALQIVGLVFLTMGFGGLVPVLEAFFRHQEAASLAPLDPAVGIGTTFLHFLFGSLFFRYPRWLVDRMKRFSRTE